MERDIRVVIGTTSACAENTQISPRPIGKHWNYLRVRGEYAVQLREAREIMELPPRARRIHFRVGYLLIGVGTTSACAENTRAWKPHPRLGRNYLRVRGEYTLTCQPTLSRSELPPRARRILFFQVFLKLRQGTTSACAENTGLRNTLSGGRRNYLRVRGEYLPSESKA